MHMAVEMMYMFFIYAVLGWVVEVAFHVLTLGKFINRGFLKGPYCPIYGFGMIFILYLLTPYRNNLPVLFILSMLVTTLIELVGGYVLEHFLHKRWWDYSNLPFNYKGYICLKFSIYWGLGALFVVKLIHPVVDDIYRYMPYMVTLIFVSVMTVMMLVDFITTLNGILGLNRQMAELDEMEAKILKLSNDMGEKITESVMKSEDNKKKIDSRIAEIKKEHDKKLEEISKKHRRIIRAFPDMRDTKHREILEKIKEKVEKNSKSK